MAAPELAVEMTQMNTRIEKSLKEQGDEALARAGYTPSRAVRALWRIAARHQQDPEALASLLAGEDPSRVAREDAEAARKRELARQGASMVGRFYERLGVSMAAAQAAQLPYNELRDEYYLERLGEGTRS